MLETWVFTVASLRTAAPRSRRSTGRGRPGRAPRARARSARRAAGRRGAARRGRSAISRAVTPGDEQRVARGDDAHAAQSSAGGAFLTRNPLAPGPERLEHVLVELERGQDDDPGARPGGRRAICRVASSPSIAGIRMSISTTSGVSPADDRERLGAVGRLADDLDVVLGLEHRPEADADELLVVDEDDADRAGSAGSTPRSARHAGDDREAAAGRRPGVERAADRRARSRMPGMPSPPPVAARAGRGVGPVVVDGPRSPPPASSDTPRPGADRRDGGALVSASWAIAVERDLGRRRDARAHRDVKTGRVDRRPAAGVCRPASAGRPARRRRGGLRRPRPPVAPPGLGRRSVVTRRCISRTAARLDASIAVSAPAVSRAPVQGPTRGRRLDADDADVVGDHVVQLAGDPSRCSSSARASCRRARVGGGATTGRPPDGGPEADGGQDRVRVASALDEGADQDDEPERRRDEEVRGVGVAAAHDGRAGDGPSSASLAGAQRGNLRRRAASRRAPSRQPQSPAAQAQATRMSHDEAHVGADQDGHGAANTSAREEQEDRDDQVQVAVERDRSIRRRTAMGGRRARGPDPPGEPRWPRSHTRGGRGGRRRATGRTARACRPAGGRASGRAPRSRSCRSCRNISYGIDWALARTTMRVPWPGAIPGARPCRSCCRRG